MPGSSRRTSTALSPGRARSPAPRASPRRTGSSGPGVHAVIDALRLSTTWHYGRSRDAGMLHAVIHGCMAVATGLCKHVLVYPP